MNISIILHFPVTPHDSSLSITTIPESFVSKVYNYILIVVK